MRSAVRGVVVAGLAIVAVAVVVGCSSGGTGSSPAQTRANVPSHIPFSGSATIGSSVTAAPGGGGGSANTFCHDFNSTDLSNLYDTSKIGQVTKVWDKLTTDAPAPISADMKAVDDYLHKVSGGNLVPPGSEFAKAIANVGKWVAGHC